MIIKKQQREPDRKASPFIGLLLFLISLVLLAVTGPLGFIYGLFHAFFSRGVRGLGEYLLKIAISIDQLGNVLMQHLLNLLWINKGGYFFGNRDETISSALGRNRQLGTLNGFGLFIDAFLDLIDPNHSLNSIDYYIEPSRAILERLSWVHIQQGKVLFLSLKGQAGYVLPGGPRVPGRSDADQLAGYLQAQLGIVASPPGVAPLGTYESRVGGPAPAAFLRQHCYTMPFTGTLSPGSHTGKLYWLGYEERHQLSAANRDILEALKEKGRL